VEEQTLTKRFGKAVRRLRSERGFSQEGFADHCGLHRTYMGSIERGEKSVSIEIAAKIAKGLELKTGKLFDEADAES